MKPQNSIDEAAKYNAALKSAEMWKNFTAMVDISEPYRAMMVKMQMTFSYVGTQQKRVAKYDYSYVILTWLHFLLVMIDEFIIKCFHRVIQLFSVDLLHFMEEQETTSFNDVAFLEGIFLSPIWKHIIPVIEMLNVMEHLCDLKKKMDDL
mgnify:CR=1 FL=1